MSDPNQVWCPLSVCSVVNPMDYGAVGTGASDDLSSLQSAIAALPVSGGIVWLPADKTFRKDGVLAITKSHVKFWAPNGQATIHGKTGNVANKQSLRFTSTAGAGVYGVRFTSDATLRGSTKDDNQIVFDGSSENEVVGVEIDGSIGTGIFCYGGLTNYFEGNYIHHTYADHIHHTAASSFSWCWDNWAYNEAPSNGDDGIACVTYGAAATRGHDMEWWCNTVLHTDGGRGYSVVGGDNIDIHHNWAMYTHSAGILVASEPGYDSASSANVTVANNIVYRTAHVTTSHTGILISGRNSNAPAVGPVTLTDNVSFGHAAGGYRTEGSVTGITNTGLLTSEGAVPLPIPTVSDAVTADTTVLRTRDTFFVALPRRAGLYRIHVRRNAADTGFEQRFEYIVKGPPDTVNAWSMARQAAGDYISERRTVGGVTYLLILCSVPVQLGTGLTAVTHSELRAGDKSGALSWLWNRVNVGIY